MKSQKPGKRISVPNVEVLNISKTGLWLYVDGQEYFLSHKQYPWFKDAKISEIYNVRFARSHLHWPDLDVDLELDSLTSPEKYPLVYK